MEGNEEGKAEREILETAKIGTDDSMLQLNNKTVGSVIIENDLPIKSLPTKKKFEVSTKGNKAKVCICFRRKICND